MPAIHKETIPFVKLSQAIVALKKAGYDRWSIQPFAPNRKYCEVRAWRYRERPDNHRRRTIVTVPNTQGAIHE